MDPLMWLAEMAVLVIALLWMSWQSKSNDLLRQRVRQLETESATTLTEQRQQKHQVASLHARVCKIERLQESTL